MKNLIVSVSRTTRMIDLPKNFIAVDGENLQSNLVFKFTDEFVNGQARLEYRLGNDKNYIILNKQDEEYSIPIKNVITKEGKINMQLVITEGTIEEEIPVFKSNVFVLYCNESINAVGEAPAGYDLWIEQANVKLNQMDNFDISQERVENGVEVSITDRYGNTTVEKINDGEKGDSGIVTFEIDTYGHLIATSTNTSDLQNYSIENGHLYLRIGE